MEDTHFHRMQDLLRTMRVEFTVQNWDNYPPTSHPSNYQPGDVSITVGQGSGAGGFVCRYYFNADGQAKGHACFG